MGTPNEWDNVHPACCYSRINLFNPNTKLRLLGKDAGLMEPNLD